jgi:Amt family ammonium transporter
MSAQNLSGLSAGIFGYKELGGLGGVSFLSQLTGSLLAVVYALVTGFIVYSIIVKVFGFRLDHEEEFRGSDLSIHHITAYPEEKVT